MHNPICKMEVRREKTNEYKTKFDGDTAGVGSGGGKWTFCARDDLKLVESASSHGISKSHVHLPSPGFEFNGF